MTELRVGAQVHGSDGVLGSVDALIVDPTVAAVTHVVVAHGRLGERRLLAIADVIEASATQVTVALDKEAFEAAAAFDEPEFETPTEGMPYGEMMLDPGAYFLEPYVTPADGWLLAQHDRVPKGEVSLRRGDAVVAAGGSHVGHVDEFLVDPSDGHITHVVLRQGHLLRHDDDVVIPVSAVAHFEEGQVVLDLDLDAVAALPRIEVRRHGHVAGGG